MHILTVSHFFEKHGGGIEIVASHLNSQFLKLGHKVSWAASREKAPDIQKLNRIPLRCINPVEKLTGLPMPLPTIGGVVALHRAVRASDVVIIHDALYVTSICAMISAKLLGKPTVLIQHIGSIAFTNFLLRGALRAANRLITRPMLKAADQLVFISDTVRRELMFSLRNRPHHLLYNGVDTQIFHCDDSRAHAEVEVRERYSLPKERDIALFVGRFVEKKGLSVLKALAAMRPDLLFVFVGAGPIDVTQWKLENAIALGKMPPQNLADIYRAADFLILPSVGEGFPLVIQEAMACGLPVICGKESAQADPGAAKWLSGVDIDLADTQASAERCEQAISRIGLTTDQRKEMAAYASQTYSWEKMAANIVGSIC